MNGYERDRKWAAQFDDHNMLIAMKALRVGRVAPALDDMRLNTDYQLILRAEPTMHRIAARTRRADYYGRHFHEITFRLARPSGVDTEWQKMLRGFGDYMIYGFAADNAGDRLRAWTVLNLAMFRQHVSEKHVNLWTPTRQHNQSGEDFIAFPILSIVRCLRCAGAIVDNHGHPWLDFELRPALFEVPQT